MYSIKINTELFDYLPDKCGDIIDTVHELTGILGGAANILAEYGGFGIEGIAEEIISEARLTEQLAEELADLRLKTIRVNEIYQRAENKIKKDISALPELINGHISRSVGPDIFQEIIIEKNEFEPARESSLLYDNSVPHEDWLFELILKNKFGG